MMMNPNGMRHNIIQTRCLPVQDAELWPLALSFEIFSIFMGIIEF